MKVHASRIGAGQPSQKEGAVLCRAVGRPNNSAVKNTAIHKADSAGCIIGPTKSDIGTAAACRSVAVRQASSVNDNLYDASELAKKLIFPQNMLVSYPGRDAN